MRKELLEIKRDILRDRKYTIKIGDEAIDLIDTMLKRPNKRDARKLLNRLIILTIDDDLGEQIYYEVAGKLNMEEDE